MTIYLIIPILIFIILFIRHIGQNVNDANELINKQTDSLYLVSNKIVYHEKLMSFIIDSSKPIIQYVFDNGSDLDKKEILDTFDKWKKESNDYKKIKETSL